MVVLNYLVFGTISWILLNTSIIYLLIYIIIVILIFILFIIYLFIHSFIQLFIYLFVCLFVYLVSFIIMIFRVAPIIYRSIGLSVYQPTFSILPAVPI